MKTLCFNFSNGAKIGQLAERNAFGESLLTLLTERQRRKAIRLPCKVIVRQNGLRSTAEVVI